MYIVHCTICHESFFCLQTLDSNKMAGYYSMYSKQIASHQTGLIRFICPKKIWDKVQGLVQQAMPGDQMNHNASD